MLLSVVCPALHISPHYVAICGLYRSTYFPTLYCHLWPVPPYTFPHIISQTAQTAIVRQQLDHALHCFFQTAIGPCVTFLLSDSNWTMRDIAIIRKQFDHVSHFYILTAIGPCVTLLLSDSTNTNVDKLNVQVVNETVIRKPSTQYLKTYRMYTTIQ